MTPLRESGENLQILSHAHVAVTVSQFFSGLYSFGASLRGTLTMSDNIPTKVNTDQRVNISTEAAQSALLLLHFLCCKDTYFTLLVARYYTLSANQTE